MLTALADIWASYRRQPLWVQLWIGIFLVPINFASVLFLDGPAGFWVAVLAIGGILPNVILMFVHRGFSKAMAISHVIIWIPLILLVVWILTQSPGLEASLVIFLWALLITDVISLIFDVPDSFKWLKGERHVT